MIAYYPNLDYSSKELTLADKIAMRNHEQSCRLAQSIEYAMLDHGLTLEEKKEEIARLARILCPIPEDCKMFFREYGYEWAQQIEWYWSQTFGTWGCTVRFEDGYILSTYPQPAPLPEPTEEEREELRKLGFYDQFGNSDLVAGANPVREEEIR